jgi:hypothetical protein
LPLRVAVWECGSLGVWQAFFDATHPAPDRISPSRPERTGLWADEPAAENARNPHGALASPAPAPPPLRDDEVRDREIRAFIRAGDLSPERRDDS